MLQLEAKGLELAGPFNPHALDHPSRAGLALSTDHKENRPITVKEAIVCVVTLKHRFPSAIGHRLRRTYRWKPTCFHVSLLITLKWSNFWSNHWSWGRFKAVTSSLALHLPFQKRFQADVLLRQIRKRKLKVKSHFEFMVSDSRSAVKSGVEAFENSHQRAAAISAIACQYFASNHGHRYWNARNLFPY